MNNEMIFLMGSPAAGKSTISNEMFGDTHVFIDCDAIAATYPDYDPKNPSITHFRASAESERVFEAAIEVAQGCWVIDGTGANAERLVNSIHRARAVGFGVRLVYVRCTLETSLKRNASRDRVVPEEVVREKAELIGTSFELVSPYVDEVIVVDNDAERVF